MTKFLNKNRVATIAGYMSALFNALILLDIDLLDYSLPSTYLKIFGAIVAPIVAGHYTEFKKD
jgi:hypothetical protein